MTDNRTLWTALSSDGRFLLVFTGLILILSGLFVIVQSLSGHFLPHDVSYLGLDAKGLSEFNNGTITKFMFHDRVSFGGSIIAVGLLYMWMAEFPLRNREPWVWYSFLISGIVGFGSFLTYMSYGYLDSWHGTATLLLLPFFITGLIKSFPHLRSKKTISRKKKISLRTMYSWGVVMLHFSAIGIFLGGITITIVGMTTVFVPQDLAYMDITVCGIEEINSKLKPLIAHDRAAFGGGLSTIGILLLVILRRADYSINLWQILALTLTVGFTSAIVVHYIIGYTDFIHLLPAHIGAFTSFLGLALTFKNMSRPIINPVQTL